MKSDKMIARVFISILGFILAMLMIGCRADPASNTLTPLPLGDTTRLEVEWIAINPPPNQDGPCWAYFSKNSHGFEYGYSGVWCEMRYERNDN